MSLELNDVISNIKADIREIYDRMGRENACLTIEVFNIIEFENRVRRSIDDARIKHDRR